MVLRFNKSFGTVFNIVQLILSVISSVLILGDQNKPDYYNMLWFLPLVYGIFTFFLIGTKPEIFKHLCFVIISGLYFFRNSLTPLFMYLGDYEGTFTRLTSVNVNKSILLMTFEMIVVMSFSRYCVKKYSDSKESYHVRFKENGVTFLLISFLVMFCIGTIIINPNFLNDFVSLFQGKILEMQILGQVLAVRGILYL